jgi:hypothetical protein
LTSAGFCDESPSHVAALSLLSRMANRVLGAFYLLLSAGLPAVPGIAVHGQTFEAPLLQCNGLPCVDVTTPKGTVRLAIDLGDPPSVLDDDAARKLGATLTPIIGPDGKPYPGYSRAALTDLKVGSGGIASINFLAQDLKKMVAAGQMPPVDGSLGYSAFKDSVLTLDYVRHRITVAPAAAAQQCTAGKLSLIHFGAHGPPIVVTTGFELNGKPVTAQLDTLYSGTILIYPTSVAKLGLNAESRTTVAETFPYTDGSVEMMRAKAKTVSFGGKLLQTDGPLYFAGPKVHLPGDVFDATVGDALFRGHVLTVDFKGMCLTFV